MDPIIHNNSMPQKTFLLCYDAHDSDVFNFTAHSTCAHYAVFSGMEITWNNGLEVGRSFRPCATIKLHASKIVLEYPRTQCSLPGGLKMVIGCEDLWVTVYSRVSQEFTNMSPNKTRTTHEMMIHDVPWPFDKIEEEVNILVNTVHMVHTHEVEKSPKPTRCQASMQVFTWSWMS